MKKLSVRGLYTVLITPFDARGHVDEDGLRQNVQFQLENDVDGLVALGTTGEAPTLSHSEKERVIKIVIEETNGKVPVMVGTGSYSTQQTIENTLHAQKMGADIALIVSPYYNKPTQEGLYQHFKAISEATTIPVMPYNIQGRTGQNIFTPTLKRIAELPNVIGVKEASGNIPQVSEVIEMIGRILPNFSVMSGDDAMILAIMALGGQGILSVVSNLIPKEIKALVTAMEKGDLATARNLHYALSSFFRAAFIETNPIPIKAAMNFCGMPSGSCRLPLCSMQSETEKQLHAALQPLLAKGFIKQSMAPCCDLFVASTI